jgi:hypothetical protein
MITKAMWQKIKDTFAYEIQNSDEARACSETNLIESNWSGLASGYRESLSDYVIGNLDNYERNFNKVNLISPIPETLRLFHAYKKAAHA